jgi:hypothetical protein
MRHDPGSSYESPDRDLPDDRTIVTRGEQDKSWWERIKRAIERGDWHVPLLLFGLASIVFFVFACIRELNQWQWSWGYLWFPAALVPIGTHVGLAYWKKGSQWMRHAAVGALLVALGGLYVWGVGFTSPSNNLHFVHLADTMNTMVAAPFDPKAAEAREGKEPFELERRPPHQNDWASYWELTMQDRSETYRGIWLDQQGDGRFKTLTGQIVYIDSANIQSRNQRYFVSFPPAPAVLMMPFVAVTGYDFNDVVWTIFFAALNVMLIYMVLRLLAVGGRSGRSLSDNLWLTLLFAFGSAHLWCSVLGEVWFTALVMGVTFTLLYMYFAIDARRPFWAGLCLALGFATRTPLLFTSIFFFAFVFFPGGRWRRSDWGDAFERLALFCLPCLVIGCTLLWMNHVRFDSITSFGHTYLAAGSLQRIQTYGLFNIHFLSKNLSAMLTLLPRFQPEPPYVIVSKHGMSLFLTTPAFFYLFLPEARESVEDRFWWRLLWAVVAVTAIPALLYQNTGFAQFGYRFAMDYLPYLIVILAVGRRPLSWLFKTCVVAGWLVNGFGAVTFKEAGTFYRNGFFI